MIFITSLLFSFIFILGTEGKNCYSRFAHYNVSTDFFAAFNFETFDDPTHGYVDYVNQDTARSMGLIKYENEKVYIGVDSTNIVQWGERGRKSIRLSSKLVLNGNNLVVIDLEHMPTTAGNAGLPKGCSVWPAFWTCGSDWPNNGEIDVIEYVNTDSKIATTLHTGDGCDQASEDISTFTGKWSDNNGSPNDNCYIYAPNQYSNTGCSIVGQDNSVGAAFNNNGVGGGVYALEWDTESQIRAFYFPRNLIPSDLLNGTPNPDSWGKPYARFEIGKDFCTSDHFHGHNIIFDNTFCGDWAGAVFGNSCGWNVSCESFVQNNPSEFVDSYWLINYVSVYNSC
jgi:hypothetical protein